MHDSDQYMVQALSYCSARRFPPDRQDRQCKISTCHRAASSTKLAPATPPCSSPSATKPPPKRSLSCSTIEPLTPTPPFSITLLPCSSSSIVILPICPNLLTVRSRFQMGQNPDFLVFICFCSRAKSMKVLRTKGMP
jgi:hypothetical protein